MSMKARVMHPTEGVIEYDRIPMATVERYASSYDYLSSVPGTIKTVYKKQGSVPDPSQTTIIAPATPSPFLPTNLGNQGEKTMTNGIYDPNVEGIQTSGLTDAIGGGISGFLGGLFSGNGQETQPTSGGLDMNMLMLMMLMGGGRSGGMSNLLLMMMLMGGSGLNLGGTTSGMLGSTPTMLWGLLPAMGSMKALMYGGTGAMIMQSLFKKPTRRRRRSRVVYKNSYRPYYPRRRY